MTASQLFTRQQKKRILILDGAMGTMIQRIVSRKPIIAATALKIGRATLKVTTTYSS